MTAFDDTQLDDSTLDGNAIGGLLQEIFGTEMTTAVGTCAAGGADVRVSYGGHFPPDVGIGCHERPADGQRHSSRTQHATFS